ncbi:hypothetical protein PC121_g23251 [Phytophthora cactorum]|nr:hypothetical protein PC120_g25532 [Phytophthora cactorum]KAG3041903.1 hypothetical protein PC121_g23251 [Phytophthora cactorum]KAG4053299.1 hypothetical protein PC123_g11550 [Phytophthora cactorum]
MVVATKSARARRSSSARQAEAGVLKVERGARNCGTLGRWHMLCSGARPSSLCR